MTIDWQHFTPWTSLAGGVLLGLSAAVFVLLNGRIAGISGVLGGLLQPRRGDVDWRVAFVAGMLLAPLAYGLFATLPVARMSTEATLLVGAGLLVGFGTRLGAGCTSGHGVCGISRLAPRSLVATLTFMVSGFLTVYLVRHVFA
ncbi:MAG: YeeE/YedE family protein [Gammaproteobacteria bacterium]|nr:YeeE/YedE family protein [Gammaproteobacteria bacterium]